MGYNEIGKRNWKSLNDEKGECMSMRPLPIGIDNFEKVITGNYYYVDKTQMIKELLDKKSEVTLFTRPRRFGKTLNMHMLQCFFENTGNDEENQKKRSLFSGLGITQQPDEYTRYMTKYPVISLSLKSARQTDFGTALECMKEDIAREYKRHSTILNSLPFEEERHRYCKIMERTGSQAEYATSLRFLSDCLKQAYGEKVIILLDEYDVPLENSYFKGFYGEMLGFIRSLFESALKSNPSLEFAVITGCLRISRESIFTGLNNLNVVSVLSSQYDEYFGFQENEVAKLLSDYGQEQNLQTVRDWYDGYQFGNAHVYNPWSVLNFVMEAMAGGNAFPKPYWSNTSSNSIVKELIAHAGLEIRTEIEALIEGKTIEKQIHEDVTYDSIHESEDNLWNFLFFTGYLKQISSRMMGDAQYIKMAIPNLEVKYIYRNSVTAWFDKIMQEKDMTAFYAALEDGNTDTMEEILTEILVGTISFYDYVESYYHGFLAGLFRGNGKYQVISNRESGLGRPDLVLRTPSVRGRAFVLEIKVADNLGNMENECQKAVRQIRERKYMDALFREGFKNVWAYGVCFWKKEVMIRRMDVPER